MQFELRGRKKKKNENEKVWKKEKDINWSSTGIVPVPWTSEAITLCPAVYFKEFAKVVKL